MADDKPLKINSNKNTAETAFIVLVVLGAVLPFILIVSSTIFFKLKWKKKKIGQESLDGFQHNSFFKVTSPQLSRSLSELDSASTQSSIPVSNEPNKNTFKVDDFESQFFQNQFQLHKPKKVPKPKIEEKRLSVISEQLNETSFDLQIPADTVEDSLSKPYSTTSSNLILQNDNVNNKPIRKNTPTHLNGVETREEISDQNSVKNSLLQMINHPPHDDFQSFTSTLENEENDEINYEDADKAEDKRKIFIQAHHRDLPAIKDKSTTPTTSRPHSSISSCNAKLYRSSLSHESFDNNFMPKEKDMKTDNENNVNFPKDKPNDKANSLVVLTRSSPYSFYSTHLIYSPTKLIENNSVKPKYSNEIDPILNPLKRSVSSHEKATKEDDLLSYSENYIDNYSFNKNLLTNTEASRYSYKGVISVPLDMRAKQEPQRYGINSNSQKIIQNYGNNEKNESNRNFYNYEPNFSVESSRIKLSESKDSSNHFNNDYSIAKAPYDLFVEKENKNTFYASSWNNSEKKEQINNRKQFFKNLEKENNYSNGNNKYSEDDLKSLEEWRRGRMVSRETTLKKDDPRFELNKIGRNRHAYMNSISSANRENNSISVQNKFSHKNYEPRKSISSLKSEEKEVLKIFDDIYKEEGFSSESSNNNNKVLKSEEKEVLKIFDDIYKEEGFSSESSNNGLKDNYDSNKRKKYEIKPYSSYDAYKFESNIKPKGYYFEKSDEILKQRQNNDEIQNLSYNILGPKIKQYTNSPSKYTDSAYRNAYNSPLVLKNHNIVYNSKSKKPKSNKNFGSNSRYSAKPYSHDPPEDYPYRRRLEIRKNEFYINSLRRS